MRNIIFFHIIFELKKFKITFAVENVYIFNNIIYVPTKYIYNREEHLIRAYDRFLKGIVKRKEMISYYSGFTPYWIDNINSTVNIYHSEFKRFVGTIYCGNDKYVKGFFVFSKALMEIFCIRLFKDSNSFNFKIIFRIK